MQKSNIKEAVLLYNIKGQPYTPQLKTILLKMGIRIIVVNNEDYSKNIGQFVGMPANPMAQPPAVAPSQAIDDEMIIMYNFTESRLNLLLSELRKEGIKIPLKAIVTPHNCNWTSYELHAELAQEREEFQKIEAKREAEQK